MLKIKHVNTALMTLVRARRVAAMGLLGCVMLAVMPVGCTNSILAAPLRYRAQHQNERHFLPDITVERLQECIERYSHQLESDLYEVEATVQVDQEGRNLGLLVVEGIPDSAPDLAACTRNTLREMAVPTSVLQLRRDQTASTTNGQTKPMGNELANPAIFVEVLVVLGEFVAQNGARAVAYTVTMAVVTPLAVYAVGKLSQRCRRVKEACIISCEESELPTGDYGGNPYHKCVRDCMERAGCF